MSDQTPRKAVMSITVDGALNVGINFGGREELLLGMLGALRYAEDWVTARIKSHQAVRQEWDQKPLRTETGKGYTAERKVSRNEALSAYQYAIDALRLRIQSIEKMPTDAQFAIDPDLLSQL